MDTKQQNPLYKDLQNGTPKFGQLPNQNMDIALSALSAVSGGYRMVLGKGGRVQGREVLRTLGGP